MTGRRFVTVDVFTNRRFGGNPLAVFPEAGGLSIDAMQRIAREFNLSETAFVFPPTDADHAADVRIFTPRSELPFAGHPSVGTAFALSRLGTVSGDVLILAEAAGAVTARLARGADGHASGATIDAPRPLSIGPAIDRALAAGAGGLAPADLVLARHEPLVASVGTAFAIAAVTAEALERATPDARGGAALGRSGVLPGLASIYLYAADAGGRLTARLFAPDDGIPEDPATGSAAAALAALLLHLAPAAPSLAVTVSQGASIDRPSLIRATAKRTPDGIRATVGGDCVLVSEGRLLD